MGRAVRIRRLERFGPVVVRVPSEEEIAENPRRTVFVGGGWVDNQDPCMINVYWHRRQDQFTTCSLLQVLEHETLHSAVHKVAGLSASIKLDNVFRPACISVAGGKLVFVNEMKLGDWEYASDVDEILEDSLE